MREGEERERERKRERERERGKVMQTEIGEAELVQLSNSRVSLIVEPLMKLKN